MIWWLEFRGVVFRSTATTASSGARAGSISSTRPSAVSKRAKAERPSLASWDRARPARSFFVKLSPRSGRDARGPRKPARAQSHPFDQSALADGRLPAKLSGMRPRLACVVFSALLAASAVAPIAKAQVLPDPHADPHESLAKPPDELPNIPKGERNRNIDFLFCALKVSPDDASTKEIEHRIGRAHV